MTRLGLEPWALSLPRWARWFSAMLFSLAVLGLLFQLAVYLHYAIALLRFPFDYDQGEGFELYDTVLHTQGRWPYQDSQVFPFYTSIYPPLFHLLTAPLVILFGPHLWTGRLVGLTASLLTAAAIGYGVWRANGRRLPLLSILCALAFIASNYTFAIGPLFRQHMTMVMFETLAIVVLARGDDRGDHKGRPYVWIGAALLICAGYTKQLALATVLAALAWLFLRGPRRAVLVGAVMALVAGGVFLWINRATEGGWYVSIIQANINEYDLQQTVGFYREWFELHAVLALAALGWLIYETYWSRLSIYSVWFVFALANSALSGKFGAGESYFVTTTAAACVCAGLTFSKLVGTGLAPVLGDHKPGDHKGRPYVAWALAVPVLFLVQARLTLHTYTEGMYAPIARVLGVADNSGRGYYDSQGYTQLGPRPTRADAEAGYRIAALAATMPGPVFSEEAALMFAAGKPVVTNPFVQLVMYQAGLFDPTEEIAMINRREFGLVILRAQFYPAPVLAALGANYQPLTEIQMNGFTYRILEPRP